MSNENYFFKKIAIKIPLSPFMKGGMPQRGYYNVALSGLKQGRLIIQV